MPDDVPSEERVRAALDEVLGWQGISRSPQLADLLRYVVDKTLAGDSGAIKAYSIAVDVLGRPTEFDPQTDPIVRVQARRLRSLLEQFYASGLSRSGIEIRLPLGRYVPEFVVTGGGPERPGVAGAPVASRGAETRPLVSPSISTALLALIFMLVGVVLTIALVRWMLPQFQSGPPVPNYPGIVIGTFDNLTGEPVLDDDVAQAAGRLREALGRFEDLRVGQEGFQLNGTVQVVNGRFVVRANLLQHSALAWTATIDGPTGQNDTDSLRMVTGQLAEQLGNATGPLHAPGRSWLKLQDTVSEPVSAYLCDLIYMRWRESRDESDAETSEWCFGSLLKQTPDLPLALAANADVSSWRQRYNAAPSDDLSELLSREAASAGRAVTLSPASSFVYEQQAMVLARQGSLDAAMGAIRKSMELNPANLDAVAVNGYLLCGDGLMDVAAAKVTIRQEIACRKLDVLVPLLDAPSHQFSRDVFRDRVRA